EERFPLLSQKDATAEEVCTVDEVKVIEFGDSYEAPQEVADTSSTSDGSAKKKGRTIAVTTKDMQKRRNDVKARTTLLLALPDEHQLTFSKYKTAQELWDAILKTFGRNEATKKTKKNQLKQQYGNFKAEGKETLEQTFNRLQAIVSHLEFMDVEIEQDDLNQKLLTSLTPEWLMHTIVWRNRSDLDTMSLDDLYNHLKVYKPKVQKKSDSQNMAFISSAKNSSGKEEVNTASFSTIKYEDINQIDEDDIEEMDIKASRSQDRGRRENYKQGSKEEEQAPKALMAIDGVGWDWSYMAIEEENHALVADEEALIEFALMAKSSYENEESRLEQEGGTSLYPRPSLFLSDLWLPKRVSRIHCSSKLFHKAHLESSTSNAQDACKADAPESSGNSNLTATSTNTPADQMETLTVETPIPTVSSPVSTAFLDDSSQLSSDTRLISKRVTSQDDTPSLDNILTLSNRFEDILGVTKNTGETNGVEANLSNMENNISGSPTPTFRIHKDHSTSQIIGPMDTLVQTKNKSKEMEEQSFVASIHHKTNPDLLEFCLFSCFLSQEEPKKISDALKDLRVRPIGTKLVLKNKKDERGIVIRNKARLVAQGHTQEEGIDYEEDPEFPARVYKVEKAMYGLHQAPKAWSSNTPIDKENPWGKDITGKDVDLNLYRSMIGSLMYLTASRPDIMFVVCACARHQVTPKECHLHAVKRIFRYLKGHPKLGIWYPKDSSFNLVAYSDSDYDGATQDRKSTTGGCQFWVED
nr:hypothetical protein [Tanacetum cinerariifolium]